MKPFSIDHDLHAHTILSSCCADPNQTVEAIVQHALEAGYTTQCITDHLWDARVLGASQWYRPQDIGHIRRVLPLPKVHGLQLLFGCETEFLGGDRIGLRLDHFDQFDFVIIPPNHFHMIGFVRPESVETPQEIADLLVQRLEEIAALPLPFHKVGIAHLTTSLVNKGGDKLLVIDSINQERYHDVMRLLAKTGVGIELNATCFQPGWEAEEELELRLYRIAKDAGCRFYLGSDAHSVEGLGAVSKVLPGVVTSLKLTEADRFWLS